MVVVGIGVNLVLVLLASRSRAGRKRAGVADVSSRPFVLYYSALIAVG